MSTATQTNRKQVPVLSNSQDALNILSSLAVRRHTKSVLDSDELKQVEALLQNFIKSPALRTAPSKNLLMAAVNALLPQGATLVSSKFNKPQLAAVLQRWVHEAELLAQPEMQNKLYIEIKLLTGSKRDIDLSQAIYIEEDDGSVAAFSISSPDHTTSDNQLEVPLTNPGSFLAELSMTPRPIGGTPTSIATSASSFARQTNGAASLQTLAATRVSNPGVPEETAPTPRGSSFEGRCPALISARNIIRPQIG